MITFSKAKFDSFFSKTTMGLIILMIVGVPLLFSPLTRSVFEVNKLLIIRLTLLIVYGLWIFKSLLYKDHAIQPPDHQCYTLFGFRWRRIGLEMATTAWILINLLSIFVSEHVYIGIIGAYDRWEGISTILNYTFLIYMIAKLIDNQKKRFAIIITTVISTFISSIYGIFQGLGVDFMNWNANSAFRVFACINNPVHFCAFVGMTTLLGFSLMYFVLEKKWDHVKLISESNTKLISLTSTSIIGLITMFVVCKETSLTTNIWYLFINLFGCLSLYHYQSILPNKKSIIFLLLFTSLICFTDFSTGFFSFNRFHYFGLGLTTISYFILSSLSNKKLFFYRASFVMSLIIFYSMILSFSRATVVSFVVAMALFFILYLQKKEIRSFKFDLIYIIATFIGLFLLNFFFIFNIYEISILSWWFSILLFGVVTICFNNIGLLTSFSWKNLCFSFLFILFCSLPFYRFEFLSSYANLVILIAYLGIWGLKPNVPKNVLKCGLISCISLSICFFSNSPQGIFYLILLIDILRRSVLGTYDHFTKEMRFSFFLTVLGMMFFTVLPQLPVVKRGFFNFLFTAPQLNFYISLLSMITVSSFVYIQSRFNKKWLFFIIPVIFLGAIGTQQTFSSSQFLTNQNSDGLSAAQSIRHRMNDIGKHAQTNARWYMWKSMPPWLLDHFWLGSGPDTIRHKYPLYRHPKYGLAEGGHNFTPDKLHNEYVNMLATRGILGFVTYYIFFIGGWFYLMLKLYHHFPQSSYRLFFIGILSSTLVFTIQILFNFGVVATLFLYYLLIGVGLSFVNDTYETA